MGSGRTSLPGIIITFQLLHLHPIEAIYLVGDVCVFEYIIELQLLLTNKIKDFVIANKYWRIKAVHTLAIFDI